MSQPDKNLEKFNNVVIKDAEEQRAKILAEIEAYRKSELEKAEEDILHEAYLMIQNEISSIKNQQSKEVSLAELEGRRKLLKQREQISDDVFAAAADRLIAYTKTPAYAGFLCGLVQKAIAEMPEGKITIRIKKDDLALSGELVKAAGRAAVVTEDPAIRLGGAILYNEEKGVVSDNTLDLKLESQRDWFIATSGLSITF